MTTASDIATTQAPVAVGSGTPAIAIKNLTMSFGQQKVLNGVSLDVSKGETLAVLGRSGTGKSVLLKVIVGLLKPDSGTVCIHGEDIAGLNLDRLGSIRKKMGFLFQNAALYDSLNVEQNVAFPLQHHRRDMTAPEQSDRVKQLLAEVGMDAALKKMPSDISGGMQKRVGLARALALDPDILLLDEPTAGLDPISAYEIVELILKLQQEHRMASVVVTHDLYSARAIAGRLALLDKGSIVIDGDYAALQRSDIKFVRDFLEHT
jgi:phospholipid/cholesterol/gamma-HCH transport system ATP-binding protein